MWAVLNKMADEAISRAMKEGVFDRLEGRGKPLRLEDDSHIPEDLRMAYKILRNAGFVPREIEEDREIERAVDLLAACTDEQERYRRIQKLNLMVTRMNMRRSRPINLEKHQLYYEKVVERVPLPGREKSDQPAHQENTP